MTNYYVAPSASGGSDSNPGTLASPKLTLAGAVTVATVAGDIINLRTGDYGFLSTGATRDGIIIQNYQTELVTVTRAHGGGDWAFNARSVLEFLGAWTNGTIRRNPLGGSFRIYHTGNPSMVNAPSGPNYLAVGNLHLDTAGVSCGAGADGMILEDLEVGPLLGYGVSIAIGNQNTRVSRCDIHNTATGIRLRGNNTIVEDSAIHDNHFMGRSGSEEDFGSEAITLEDATNWTIVNNDLYENWSQDGSPQFGAEGGSISYFNVPDGGGGTIVGNRSWNNQNFIETGNNTAGRNGGGPNAEIAYNVVFGKNDYQIQTSGQTNPLGGTSAGPLPPSTAFMLIRTMRDTDIHHNTWDVNDGSADNAGIRMVWGGTFGQFGDYRGMRVYDNIFRVRFATPIYNANNQGWNVNAYTTPESCMVGVQFDHNLVYYTFDRGTGNVFASTGTADDATVNSGPTTQLTVVRGLLAGDVWGDTNTNQAAADPDFVDATNVNLALRDYRLLPGSPALTMSRTGGPVGALGLASSGITHDGAGTVSGVATKTGTALLIHGARVTAPGVATVIADGTIGTSNIQDTFTRFASNGWGDAETGGTWTVAQGAVSNYAVDGSQGTVATSAASPSRTVRLMSIAAQDISGAGRIKVDQVLTGTGSIYAAVFVRRTADNLNNYRFILHFDAGGGTHVDVSRYTSGTETTLRQQGGGSQLPLLLGGGGVSLALPVPAGAPTYTAGGWIRYRYSVTTISPGVAQLSWRVWTDGSAEPGTWDITTTDNTVLNQASGDFALVSFTGSGITNPAIVISHDDLLANLPFITHNAAASVTGLAMVATAGERVVQATASLSALALTSGIGSRTFSGAASQTGLATVAGAGQKIHAGAASVTGTASTTALAALSRDAAASVSGVATLVASGSRTISGTGSVTGLASPTAFGGLILKSSYTDFDDGIPHALATVVANGSQIYAASADVLGFAEMTTEISTDIEGAAQVTGHAWPGPGDDDINSAQLILGGRASIAASAAMSGLGSRTISSSGLADALADTFGLANIVQETTGILFAEADVEGEATQDVETGNAILVGEATVEAVGTRELNAAAEVVGVSIEEFAEGELVIDATASIVGAAQVGDTVEVIRDASAEIFGVATILGRNIQRPGYAHLRVRQDTAELVNA